MSVPSIPQDYTITLEGQTNQPIGAQVTGDSSRPVGAKVTGDANQPIGTKVTGDPNNPVGTKVTGDPSHPIGTKVTGDPNNPVGTKVTGDPNQPIGTKVTGDPNQPIGTKVTGDANQPIGTKVTGDPVHPIGTQITGDPKQPVATTVDMLNIPHLTLNNIKDILTPKIRVHMPNYEQVSFKVFGKEVFSVCVSGEMQMITQPYVPNAYEQCKIECPDEDKRPFPETKKYDEAKMAEEAGFIFRNEEIVKEEK